MKENLLYIGKRILMMIPTFFIITLAVYVLINFAPGNVVDNIIANSTGITQEQIDALYAEYDLDKPVLVRYVMWVVDLFQGDLGESYTTGSSVSSMVGERIGPTLILTGTSLLISLVIGIPLGIASALRKGGFWDGLSSFITFIGNSLPSFFVALVAISFFAVDLDILPASGMYYSGEEANLPSLLIHLVLPSSVLSLSITGAFIKQTRSSMLEVMNKDYIKTVRSKGVSRSTVNIKHVFRNALLPIVTQIGLMVPFLIGGVVVIEQIFSWPGLGSLMNTAILGRDYPTVMGITVVIALIVLITNVVMDIIYTFVDPRIKLA